MNGKSFGLKTERAYCVLCGDSAPSMPIAAGWDFEYSTTLVEHLMCRCLSCGTVFIRNRPVPCEMGRIYAGNYYANDDSQGKSTITGYFRKLIESSKVKYFVDTLRRENNRVIDIGCGDGRLLDVFSGLAPEWQYSGIDISAAAAAAAQAKGNLVVQGNIEGDKLPWVDGTFNLALMHQVIEHTRDPREVLRRVNRLLEKGGLLSIETPDTAGLDFRLFRNRYWGGYHIPRHFYLFNKHSITELLRDSGFEVIRVKSILSPVFWIHSVHNWLVDRKWGRGLAKAFHYRNPVLLAMATIIEIVQISLFRQSSNMQVIARKMS